MYVSVGGPSHMPQFCPRAWPVPVRPVWLCCACHQSNPDLHVASGSNPDVCLRGPPSHMPSGSRRLYVLCMAVQSWSWLWHQSSSYRGLWKEGCLGQMGKAPGCTHWTGKGSGAAAPWGAEGAGVVSCGGEHEVTRMLEGDSQGQPHWGRNDLAFRQGQRGSSCASAGTESRGGRIGNASSARHRSIAQISKQRLNLSRS